jgi:hypothetical protein
MRPRTGKMKMRKERKGEVGGQRRRLPDNCDFPFIDVGIIDEAGRVPWFRLLLNFLYINKMEIKFVRCTRSCRLKRVSDALVAMLRKLQITQTDDRSITKEKRNWIQKDDFIEPNELLGIGKSWS